MYGKFTPTDIIAVVICIGALYVLATSPTPEMSALLTMIVGYYFGKRASGNPYDNDGKK